MTSKKASSLALRLAAAALACACAALAGCGERRVPPNETRAADDALDRRTAELAAASKDLNRLRLKAAHELAEARKAGADAARIAALERQARQALEDFKANHRRREALCEERRLAREQSQKSKR